ncbi:hypothetical protein [Paenibacillus alkalitolerans]|uniref:hypothetical protein n=1 Tax=Paenibacillus alkalitolerans TaxID=2799335 RepID=UPI0018F2DE5D|nr:hypothetical protein [Paenibacillus alkalitolerans]
MTNLYISKLRVFKAVLGLIIFLFLSLSPVLLQDANALETTEKLEIRHPGSEVVGIKNVLSLQKLLPLPILQFIFYIVPLATIVRVIRLSRLQYPAVFLLRMKQFLLPIKFTSIFLGCPAAYA